MFTARFIQLDIGLAIVLLTGLISPSVGKEYRITTTWDNRTIDHPNNPVIIKLEPRDETTFKILVDAPFFNDPAPDGPPGEPFYGLWDYEVVEVFLLNDQNQYVEIELSPWGQHIVLLLNGQRKTIRHSLLIDFTVNRTSTKWSGEAIIPLEYVPVNVTKMNAYAIHGVDPARVYEALYPVPFNSAQGADFHKLDAFQPFDWKIIATEIASSYSSVWMDSFRGFRKLAIKHTWNGTLLSQDDILYVDIETRSGFGLVVNIDAPFYNDVVPPAFVSGWPFDGSLSTYEVLHLILFGEDSRYLELQLSPWGHFAVIFGSDQEATNFQDSISFQTDNLMKDERWYGYAVIPLSYLPPQVTKCNAHFAHGPTNQREIYSLYPANPSDTEPNFHLFKYARAIDLSMIYPDNDKANCSTLWTERDDSCTSEAKDNSALTDAVPSLLVSMSSLVFVLIMQV